MGVFRCIPCLLGSTCGGLYLVTNTMDGVGGAGRTGIILGPTNLSHQKYLWEKRDLN